jgi:hypothetical protein
VHLDAAFARNGLELLVDIIQHLTAYFQSFQDSFVGVLKT